MCKVTQLVRIYKRQLKKNNNLPEFQSKLQKLIAKGLKHKKYDRILSRSYSYVESKTK